MGVSEEGEVGRALEDHKECVGGNWGFHISGLRKVCDLGGDAKESHTLINILHIQVLTYN